MLRLVILPATPRSRPPTGCIGQTLPQDHPLGHSLLLDVFGIFGQIKVTILSSIISLQMLESDQTISDYVAHAGFVLALTYWRLIESYCHMVR